LVQLRIAAVFAMIVSVSGCGHESGAPTSPSSSTLTASAVVVSGTAPFVGTTAQFVATATLSNSASQGVTAQAAWSSSNSTIATVSSDGTVTGVAAGDVDITATYQNVAGHVHVTITSVPNYQGFWTGDYSATACDGVNGLCDPGDLGVGSVHSTYLNLMQNGTTVTGTMSIGLGLPAVSGRVDGNGHLVLSGTWTCGCALGRTAYTGTISDFDAVVAGSSMSGHWTMTFTSVLSTGPSGTAQVVIQTLTRN
jgi:hypothetical protein